MAIRTRRDIKRVGMTSYAVVVPLAARTTSSNSGAVTGWHSMQSGPPQSRLAITAASGTTPTLDVVIQDSPDGTTWTTRDTYPQQTGTATVTRALPTTLAAFQRVLWTVGGTTPSFTFSVQFAHRTELLQAS